LISSKQIGEDRITITQIVKSYKRNTVGPANLEASLDSFNKLRMQPEDSRTKLGNVSQILNKSGSLRPKKQQLEVEFSKSPLLNYEEGVLIDFILDNEDPFSASVILKLFKFLNHLIENISSFASLQYPVAKSSLIWRMLLFLMNDYSNWPLPFMLEPSTIDRYICSTFRFIFSHCDHLIRNGKSKPAKEEEKGEEEKLSQEDQGLIEHFKMCQALLRQKLTEKLVAKIKISETGKIEVLDDYD